MTAYVYQAAYLCEDCARDVLRANALRSNPEGHECDASDCCPQGPYPDGGGEADSPQHCDQCGEFLENPLTLDGEQYVKSAIQQAMQMGELDRSAYAVWAPYYFPVMFR